MPKVTQASRRKADHIRINLEEDVRSGVTTGLERLQLEHNALPEIDLGEVDTTLTFLGRRLLSPILISSMTGGTPAAGRINRALPAAGPARGALQAEGDIRFAGLLRRIEAVCRHLEVPVIAKEVGWGISAEAAARLKRAGVRAIDVAGAGGASWAPGAQPR